MDTCCCAWRCQAWRAGVSFACPFVTDRSSMMKHAQSFVPTSVLDLSSTWFSACMQPWTMWQGWTQAWLDSMAAMPNVWMPALAAGRKNQPAAIDFFLPWMPRVNATVSPLDGHSPDDAVRVMMRATLPFLGGLAGEGLLVDAKVTRQKGVAQIRDITPARSALPSQKASVAATVAAVEPAEKAAAPKRAPRKPRKPAADAGPA